VPRGGRSQRASLELRAVTGAPSGIADGPENCSTALRRPMSMGRAGGLTTAVVALLAVVASACSSDQRPDSRTADPAPTPDERPGLCQPFPDRLIDGFVAAYNGRDLEILQDMVDAEPVRDVAAAAYSGTATFANIAEWAKGGWKAKDRMSLAGYTAFHPTKRGFQMHLTRRSSVLKANGIDEVSMTLDAISAGCSIASLQMSGIVQAKREPCAFYQRFMAIRDIAENEPAGCSDGSSDHARVNHGMVWSGGRVLIWGGDRGGLFGFPDAIQSGVSYDPGSKRWQRIPEAMLPPFTVEVSAWTGGEMLVLGSALRGSRVLMAAYSSLQRTWRIIHFPFPEWNGFEGVWTGDQLVLWGGGPNSSSRFSRRGAVYDPTIGTWQRTAPAPIAGRDAHAMGWTGSEVIVWGGSNAETDLADGAAYNPSTDTWREIAPAPLTQRQWMPIVWTGAEIVVWGGSSFSINRADGAAYDPVNDSWRKLPRSPLRPRHYHSAVWSGSEVVVFGGYNYHRTFRDGAAYDPTSDTWRRIERAPIKARCCHAAVWAGDSMFVFGGHRQLGHMALGDGAIYRPEANRWERVVPRFNVPDCVVDLASDAYGTEITPHRGRPGDVVKISGTTMRGEDGRWASSDRLEAWWNTKSPGGPPLMDGPVVKLVQVDDMRRCRFQAQFNVPDVEPGTYLVTIVTWDSPPSEGYGLALPERFIVK
jgi:N-acetylneuraminic acid mutarotase